MAMPFSVLVWMGLNVDIVRKQICLSIEAQQHLCYRYRLCCAHVVHAVFGASVSLSAVIEAHR